MNLFHENVLSSICLFISMPKARGIFYDFLSIGLNMKENNVFHFTVYYLHTTDYDTLLATWTG